MTHEEALHSIDRHFAGRLSVAREAAMRAHMPGCEACADRYERHLVLARIDPGAGPAIERLARGLGLSTTAPRARRPAWWVATAAALATATAFVLMIHARSAPDEAHDVVRGAAAPGELWVYRVTDGAAPRLATHELASGDELAFAYANPSAKAFLSIFGADEHGHVYWYYPAWPVGTPPPAAVPARGGVGPHELPEAVRHPLDGRHLDLYAVFSDERVGVADLEGAARARATNGELEAHRGTIVVRRSFEVSR